MLVSAALCGERLSVRFALCAIGAVGGITCITLPGLMGSTLDPHGTFLGLSSALFHAGYILLLRRRCVRSNGLGGPAGWWWRRRSWSEAHEQLSFLTTFPPTHSPSLPRLHSHAPRRRSQQHESRLHVVPNLMVSTFSSTVTLMALATYNGEPLPYIGGLDGESFVGVVAVALFVQVGGWILFSRGLPALPAGVASLILLMNPPLTMLWAWLVFDERVTLLDGFGGMITLACIYYGSEPAAQKAPAQDGASELESKGKKPLGAINDDEDA